MVAKGAVLQLPAESDPSRYCKARKTRAAALREKRITGESG